MLKPVKIKDKVLEVPIIQGGMGIGVSLSNLALAVRKEGGMGVISAAMPGFQEPDFETQPIQANIRALQREIQKAKMTERGLLGVNIMVASQNYGTYEGEGATYQIWLEDSKSIAEKVKLIKKYKLAGVAEWKLGFENSGIWSVITENLS